jgi:hypothetical protein
MNALTIPMEKTNEETNKKKPQFPDDSAERKPAGVEACTSLLRCPHVWQKNANAKPLQFKHLEITLEEMGGGMDVRAAVNWPRTVKCLHFIKSMYLLFPKGRRRHWDTIRHLNNSYKNVRRCHSPF